MTGCLVLAGQDTAQVDGLRQPAAGYSTAHPRSRTLCAARLATLLLRSGEGDEAVQLGHQALDAAEHLQSHRITDSIRELHRAASRHRGTADVDALRRRTARALAG